MKSRRLDEYALAAMALLDQVAVSEEDVTTVEIPSAWLREMQAWSRRITAPRPKREPKIGGRKRNEERLPDYSDLSLDRGESANWTQPDHRERLEP